MKDLHPWLTWQDYLTEIWFKQSKPSISDFKEGDRFYYKVGFMDGTVKTRKQFHKAKWVEDTYTKEKKPYLERALSGKNSENGICGILKY